MRSKWRPVVLDGLFPAITVDIWTAFKNRFHASLQLSFSKNTFLDFWVGQGAKAVGISLWPTLFSKNFIE